MAKYKVRFNLGRGTERYQKWQVTDDMGVSRHFEPEKVTLVMSGCRLHNSPKTALKIFEGDHKTVCAWVSCDWVDVVDTKAIVGTKDHHVRYNPRKDIHWNIEGENVDNSEHDLIYTSGRELYIPYDTFGNGNS